MVIDFIDETKEAVRLVKRWADKSQERILPFESTLIGRSLERRDCGESFCTSEHVRAMIYSLLSSSTHWINCRICPETGTVLKLDAAFHKYSPSCLKDCTASELLDKFAEANVWPRFKNKQTKAIPYNIKKLLSFEEKCGSVDGFYQSYMAQDSTGWELVEALGGRPSETKMEQMGIPLTAEYLRNVGFDLPKPDRHICRFLGSERLGLYGKKTVPEKEAFHLMIDLAKEIEMPVARLDYILWAYYSKNCAGPEKRQEVRCKCCVIKHLCAFGKKV